MTRTEVDPATWSVAEFAALMGISETAAYRLCAPKDGQAPAVPNFRLGRTIRISKAWVAGLLDGRYEIAHG